MAFQPRLAVSDSAAPWRRYRPALLVGSAGLLFLSAYAAGLAVRPSERFLNIQSNLVYNIPAFVALGLSFIPIRNSRGRERLAWLCLAFLLASWQAGDWLFSYYDLVRHTEPPFPGYADLAYYAGYVAFIAAIPLLTFPERRLHDRRWLLDAGVVTVIAGTISWEYLLRPIVADSGSGYFEAAVALGYPLFDLVLLTTLVVTLFAARDRYPVYVLALIAAVVFQVFTDAGYTYLVTTVGYDNVGNPLEIGWLAGYVLLAISFVLPHDSAARAGVVRPSILGLVLPYATAVPLITLLITTSLVGAHSLALLGGAISALTLVVARQFLTLRDNLSILIQAANYDELTGLPNRRRLVENLGRQVSLSRRRHAQGALLLLGLDDFKAVNDSLGHRTGDEAIIKVADLLRDRFGAQELLGRLGGDEFAVVLQEASTQEAETMGRDLLETLRQRPIVVGNHIIRTTASVGVALFPEHGGSAGDLLASASLAMSDAKAAGGNEVFLYDAATERQALGASRLVWKRRITEALEQDAFELFCQPVFDLRSGAVHEYELLLRLRDEEGELVLPGRFLGVAEAVGLIHDIDRWVLKRAVSLLAGEQRRGRNTRFAVNLSGKAFESNDLLPYVERTIASAGIDPSLLILEITETAAIANLDRAQKFVRSLKGLGCRFALDDFGAGFSSFYHLKQLPVDYLKIDGSFIANLPRDLVDQQLVKAMVGVARGLDRKTVAEFVQDPETVALLRELGVDYGQGFYLGRPAPANEALGRKDGALPKAA